jgi:hypothetical protein
VKETIDANRDCGTQARLNLTHTHKSFLTKTVTIINTKMDEDEEENSREGTHNTCSNWSMIHEFYIM